MSEKKRKMIDVDPAVVEMFARVLQKLKPPPKLTISEWADWFRQMSPEASAGTGRWHTDNAPYQREIMDAIGNPHVRMVVFKSSSQVGKTEVLLNVLGYYIDYNPAPILVLQPTVEMGQTFSKDRLAPMIRDTAVLRKKMDAKSRFSGNTIMQKTFPGGHVTIVGANSPAGLASRPIKIVLADEVDRYPVSAGTEGDPLNLAQTRQTTFWDKKTVLVSTPTIKGSSRIEKSWLESTMEEWTVPCPECGEYQPMVWANVVFDRERWPKGGVQYRCESCGCIAGEYRWKAQGRKTEFVPSFAFSETTYPGATDPKLEGKPVMVLAVKGENPDSCTYSFLSMAALVDTYKAKATGKDKSTTVTIADYEVDVKVNVSAAAGNILTLKDDGLYVPTPEKTDISGKADKAKSATAGNFAALDADGNLTDSGKKSADFVAAETGKRLMSDDEGTKLAGVSEGATKTAASATNGHITIDGKDTVVYAEPENVLHTEDVSDFTAEEIAALLADD